MKTYGFDYAFAIPLAEINDAIARNVSGTPATIKYDTVDDKSGSTISFSGILEPWKITSGGKITLLNILVSFSTGSLVVSGGPAGNGSYDLAGVGVVLQAQLSWLGPGDQAQAQGGASATSLVFNPTDTNQADNPGYVAVYQLIDPMKKLDSFGQACFTGYMAAALVSNRASVQYTLADVVPQPRSLASWLYPKAWTYLYQPNQSGDYLCILSMLSDGAMPQSVFDGSMLDGRSCVLLVSQPAFFSNVVLPSIRNSFPGGSFTLSTTDENSKIDNQGDVNFDDITAYGMEVKQSDAGTGLHVSANGGGPLKFLFGLAKLPDASYSWSINANGLASLSNGNFVIARDPNPTITQDHDIKWYDWVLLGTVGITSMPGLIAAIYDAVQKMHDQAQSVGLDRINDDLQAAMGGSASHLQDLVDWRLGGKSFSASQGGIAGALYLRGTLN